jgi:anaerobic magnesium-protoporphyrin IX monomethyl ester cyclase
MITMSRSALRIAEELRTLLPDCLLVAGGPLPTLYPDQYAKRFDAVFRGEADVAFPAFCQDFISQNLSRDRLSEMPLEKYPGLFIRQTGLQADSPAVHYSEKELSGFPIPNRLDFDHAAYQDAWSRIDGSKTTSIITTLGCTFSCDFCSRPIFGSLFRRKNLDRVFEEIEQIRLLGYDCLWIADDNFSLDPDFLLEFCRRIGPLNLTWSCLSRVNGIDVNTIRIMKESGCKRVYLGLESGSPTTLKLMKKQATPEQGIRAVRLFREAGVQAAGFFIVGYPGETVSSIEETFRFALSLPLDIISFNVPFPLPGSDLFDRVVDVDSCMDWSAENEITFVYKSEFDPAWLRRRIDETIDAFSTKEKQPRILTGGIGVPKKGFISRV